MHASIFRHILEVVSLSCIRFYIFLSLSGSTFDIERIDTKVEGAPVKGYT